MVKGKRLLCLYPHCCKKSGRAHGRPVGGPSVRGNSGGAGLWKKKDPFFVTRNKGRGTFSKQEPCN